MLEQSLGGDVPFLDPEKQVLSVSGEPVGGNLLDKEILGISLQRSLDRRRVGIQPG